MVMVEGSPEMRGSGHRWWFATLLSMMATVPATSGEGEGEDEMQERAASSEMWSNRRRAT
jgi:hypothetical protein